MSGTAAPLPPGLPWCATLSRERAEPMAGTASRVERWLLVEHRGAWGPATLPLARMGAEAAAAVVAAAAAGRARLLLLRRPRGAPQEQGRWVYAVDSRPGRERTWRRHVRDDEELRTLVPPFEQEQPGWTAYDERLLLVCTHGRNDRCCALRGRPLALALAALRAEAVWECTHIGGDRFAANLLVLPEGLYLGRVEAGEAPAILAGLEQDELPSRLLRGRSSLSLPAQAAQQAARERLGRDALADLAVVRQEPVGRQEGVAPDRWRVLLRGSAGRPEVEVEVRYDRAQPAAVLSCGDGAKVAPVFRVEDLRVLPAVS